MSSTKTHGVGYKRPPAERRFKPGQSGNPAGRPKGRKNFATLVRRLLVGDIEVSVGGKKRKMSRVEALLVGLFNKAIAGDLKALPLALNVASACYRDEADNGARDPEADRQQLELIRQLLRPVAASE
jgi:hypothetical protein